MKNSILILLLFVLIGLPGCYKDLGSYDYKDLNEISLSFIPENSGSEYIYGQPSRDTLKVIYSPVVSQTAYQNSENLKYKWVVRYNVKNSVNKDSLVTDETESRELTLEFPPNKETVYSVLFSLTDESNGTSYYRSLTMKTMLPFMNSWFVLHGDPGNRKLGVIEKPDKETGRQISYNIYETLFGEKKFQNAEHLLYIGTNQADPSWDLDKLQQLLIAGRDSMFFAYAQKLSIERRYETIMPDMEGNHPGIIDVAASPIQAFSLLMDDEHRLYHSGGEGIYYMVKTSASLSNYQADKIFVSQDGMATVWDETNRKLMYYHFGYNYYSVPRDEGGNMASLTPVNFPATYTLPGSDEPIDREIVWLGKRIHASASGLEGASILAKDSIYNFYQINYGGSGEIEMSTVKINKLDINEKSCLAVSSAFANQLFYSLENSVYWLNLVSGEVKMLYNAGALVTKLQFRIVDPIYDVFSEGEERVLAVVVQKGKQGELHELFFTEGADISKVTVNTGFGPIQDVTFSIVTWNMFDKPIGR